MANGTITTGNIDASTLSGIASDLAAFSRAAGALQKKIDALLPRMGSDAWWEKELEDGMESIKSHQGISVTSKEELKKLLMV